MTAVRFTLPSSVNDENTLYFVIEPDKIVTKFACHRSHEHYEIDSDSPEEFDRIYGYAIDEFAKPVLSDQLVVVWYGNGGMLVPDADQFVRTNSISTYTVESWNTDASRNAG